jgi:hypothetical protein
MTNWGVFQFHPGLPAEGDSPEIPAEEPELLASGFETEEKATEAIDLVYGDRFDVGVMEIE